MNFGKAGVILINKNNEVLLVKNYSGKWSFPKGSIEYKETAKEAAARELLEETGIQLSLDNFKIYYKYYKQIYFLCDSRSLNYKEELIKDKTEITGIGWFCVKHLNMFNVSAPTLKILKMIYNDVECLINQNGLCRSIKTN
jgi:8-oxo-dGTP pyrophosphatase MutT (NUDIX family)